MIWFTFLNFLLVSRTEWWFTPCCLSQGAKNSGNLSGRRWPKATSVGVDCLRILHSILTQHGVKPATEASDRATSFHEIKYQHCKEIHQFRGIVTFWEVTFPRSEGEDSLENLCTKMSPCVFPSDPPFPPLLTLLLPRSQDRTIVGDNLCTVSQSPFWISFLLSNAFMSSCFPGPHIYQSLLSNSSFMLQWKWLIPITQI